MSSVVPSPSNAEQRAPSCPQCQQPDVMPVPTSGLNPGVQYYSCKACGCVFGTRPEDDDAPLFV
jgi:hypothetical protein